MTTKSMAMLLLAAGGCAKAGFIQNRGDGGGDVDLAASGAEGGVDLATAHDLAGVDFSGVDFAGSSSDLASSCNLVPQSGCNAGEKCSYDGTKNSCVTAGTVQNGQICGAGGADDCVAGDECVANGATSTVNACRQFCNTDTDCTQAPVAANGTAEPNNKGHCLLKLTGTSASLCSFACSPVGTSGCAAGLACQTWTSTAVPEFTDCGPAGTVGDGGNCPNGNKDCLPGYGCVQTAAGPPPVVHCRKLCRKGMPGADCPVGGSLCVVPGAGTGMFGFCCAGAC